MNGKGSRSGAPNYSSEDVQQLLDITEKMLPIGANYWAAVAASFNNWADAQIKTKREADSLKLKFDKQI